MTGARAHAFALLLGLVTALAPTAHAADPDQNLTRARAYVDAAEWDAALPFLEAALAATPTDEVRALLGRTYAALYRCDDALRVLDTLTAPLGADARAAALTCRELALNQALSTFRCQDALAAIDALFPLVKGAKRTDLAKTRQTTRRCAETFATTTEPGRTAAREYDRARAALIAQRGADALAAADLSLAAQPTPIARLARGLALAQTGRCADALPLLDAAPDPKTLPDFERTEHAKSTNTCLFILARTHVEESRCHEALPLLRRLDGQLEGLEATWRKDKATWCEARVTAFVSDTPKRKKALKHFEAARDATREGDVKKAAGLYKKALALVDEPIIRHELARVQIDFRPCATVVETLRGIDPSAWEVEDAATIAACSRFAPPDRIDPTPRATWVRTIVSALLMQDQGDAAGALELLAELPAPATRAVEALQIDLTFEADDCATYTKTVEALSEAKRLGLTDPRPRLLKCQRQLADVTSTTEPAPQPTHEPSPEPTPTRPETSSPLEVRTSDRAADKAWLQGGPASTSGWVMLGGGVAMMGVSAYFTATYFGRAGSIDDAADDWANGSPADAIVARERYFFEQGQAERDSAVAIGTGIAGVAAVTTGILLIALGGDDDGDDDSAGTTLRPTAGPGGVGLVGSFR